MDVTSPARTLRVGLLGDAVQGYAKHDALAPALETAARHLGLGVEAEWIASSALATDPAAALAGLHAAVATPQSADYCREPAGLLAGLGWCGSRACAVSPSAAERSTRCGSTWAAPGGKRQPLFAGGVRSAGVTESLGTTLFEWADHPFYLAPLFLPQWSEEQPHPLFIALLQAAVDYRGDPRT